MIATLLEKYVDSRFSLPPYVLQSLLNFLVSLDHRICVLLGTNYSAGAEESEEIAEKSSELMSVHYDQPLALFENFLGDSMKYSMGLWENGAQNLEQAQEAMLEDICEKAQIADGHNILDIGCGFGSFAVHILNKFPRSKVWGLTLSQVQADYIRAKQKEAGHPLNSSRFHLIQEDFNTVRFKRKFERIVSIGVFEHVSNLDKGLAKLREFLDEDGRVLLHYIVFFRQLARMSSKPLQSSFLAKHIFPGGRIWFVESLKRCQRHLAIENSWLLNGSNYERTLQCWLKNLHEGSEALQAAELKPHLVKLLDLHFHLCVGIFHANRGRFYGNAQYLLKHV